MISFWGIHMRLEHTHTQVAYTHVDDPVLRVVSVGATYVQAVVGHGLDDPDVVAAVVLLRREKVACSVRSALVKGYNVSEIFM